MELLLESWDGRAPGPPATWKKLFFSFRFQVFKWGESGGAEGALETFQPGRGCFIHIQSFKLGHLEVGFSFMFLVLKQQRWANNLVFEYYSNNKYSYSYSTTNWNPSIIRIRIRPKPWVRILFVFGYFENMNIIRLSIRPPLYRTGVNKKPFSW